MTNITIDQKQLIELLAQGIDENVCEYYFLIDQYICAETNKTMALLGIPQKEMGKIRAQVRKKIMFRGLQTLLKELKQDASRQ